MRIGIYGGSFDPPHIGHLLVAGDACDSLSLDVLFVVPAGVQPLKTARPDGASAADRLAMARLAFAGDPRIEVTAVEIERTGLSYSVDTVEEFSRRYPGADLFFLIGEDARTDLPRWRNPERIRELSTLAILERSGSRPVAESSLDGEIIVSTRRIDVSSTEIRERVREGKGIAGFVRDSVEQFIHANGLYAKH